MRWQHGKKLTNKMWARDERLNENWMKFEWNFWLNWTETESYFSYWLIIIIIIIIIFFFWAPSTTFLGALNIEDEYNSGWQMAAC